ncbi:helix-turn-helix domain-containing protein [Altererythrobacter sp. KTW20L]|uniref:helix-turn-helix domain-containing protein n=1 Tax=Altererythrobacter sp. KTW20L TaxID=2942210 RepID=UPI0020BFF879|nr:helix-turn-helix domain-containing protein [Altererythrobacter sp. KTW20L]MCL6250571.1 helix-turn-helix domain-containing protein [Altererythrobacter sp. KTW20L]
MGSSFSSIFVIEVSWILRGDHNRCEICARECPPLIFGRGLAYSAGWATPLETIDASQVRSLRDQGLGGTEIASKLGIARASVYRILASVS